MVVQGTPWNVNGNLPLVRSVKYNHNDKEPKTFHIIQKPYILIWNVLWNVLCNVLGIYCKLSIEGISRTGWMWLGA